MFSRRAYCVPSDDPWNNICIDPTQYAPLVAYCVCRIHKMLQWSILCMQGTQYATKRSILCRGAFCGPTALFWMIKSSALLTYVLRYFVKNNLLFRIMDSLKRKSPINTKWKVNAFLLDRSHWLCNSYTLGCPHVRGDNPQPLASGLSYVQVDTHGATVLYMYHLHQCRLCTSDEISC